MFNLVSDFPQYAISVVVPFSLHFRFPLSVSFLFSLVRYPILSPASRREDGAASSLRFPRLPYGGSSFYLAIFLCPLLPQGGGGRILGAFRIVPTFVWSKFELCWQHNIALAIFLTRFRMKSSTSRIILSI